MTSRAKGIGLSSLVVASLIACGHSNDGGAPSTSASGTATLADHVTVFTGSDAEDVVVSPTNLVMPQTTHQALLLAKAGDVLVGDRGTMAGTQNPSGFLRKVISIQKDDTAGTLTITTDRAYLTDAVKQGTLSGTLQTPTLGLTGPVSQNARGGDLQTLNGSTTVKILDYSGTKIFSESGTIPLQNTTHVAGYTASATLSTGTLNFVPSWDVGADIEPDLSNLLGSVKELHVIATGTLATDVEVNFVLELAAGLSPADQAAFRAQQLVQTKSLTLANYPVSLGSLNLGVINVPVTAQFTATLDCNLKWGGDANLTVGAKASGSVTAGFRYDGTNFSPVESQSESFTTVGPNGNIVSPLYAHCSINPKFELQFFGVATGDLVATGYAEGNVQDDCTASKTTGTMTGYLVGGASAFARAQVDVFGLFKWEKDCTLFALQSPNAAFSGTDTAGSACVPATAPPANPNVTTPASSCFSGTNSGGSSSGDDSSTGGSDAGAGSTGDDASSGDDASASSGDDGGSSANEDGGTCSLGDTPPDGWTCAASQYGDCKCDCNCGAPDEDCTAGQCSACTHDVCSTTDTSPLGSTCTMDGQGGACIAAICANDSYCCETAWTASCIQHIIDGDFGCTPNPNCGQ